jgi:aminodeoxyfutalosine deaminase
MRHFSAHYIFTNAGPPLKKATISTEDDGTIISIEQPAGSPEEKESVEFYNGIIIPGFVNCHCHLELSHLKSKISQGNGLGDFIKQVRSQREITHNEIISSEYSADNDMYREGVVLCADVCNTSNTFNLKKESKIHYINFLEVFGIDPAKAEKRMDEISRVAAEAEDLNMQFWMVPHSVYSLSLPLFHLLREKTELNRITSIHFMETAEEKVFLESHSGAIMNSYKESGLVTPELKTVESHTSAVLNEITTSGNLILVHNTFVDRDQLRILKQRENKFLCLCPNSNLYIEKKVPPLNLLVEEDCEIVIGTDSLASNNKLSILEELKTLQQFFPLIEIEALIRWATINGARALGEEGWAGKIEPGKKPGLLILQNVDLLNNRLLPESNVRRLI